MIIGAGIGGIQAAIDLVDQGFKVLLIEKRYSIGGVMIQLSKTFPTLDCGSCITTPKMSEAYKHDNVDVRTLAAVTSVKKEGEGYRKKEGGGYSKKEGGGYRKKEGGRRRDKGDSRKNSDTRQTWPDRRKKPYNKK